MAKLDVGRLIREVESGLATEAKHRMDRAREAMDFYNFDGHQHLQRFHNDAETPLDYIKRPYIESGVTRQAVKILTQHLYNPGPARRWDDGGAEAFLEKVYADNHIDAIMLRADQLSTLGDVCAVQVECEDFGTGLPDPERPVKLRLWGAEEFHVWEDPDDRCTPAAVVTKDMYDQTTRYRLWTDERAYTFQTRKGDATSGGRVAFKVKEDKNTYGCLPFAFVHNEYPARCFWETGVGDFVKKSEIADNNLMSRLAQSIYKHMNPFPWAKGVPPGFQVILGQPNMFITLPGRARVPSASGDYQSPETPEVGYLQATIDIAGALEFRRACILQMFEAVGIPQSAVRMEQTGVASGISLIVEQAPLLARAVERRPYFGRYEQALGRTVLRCAGNHYGRPELGAAAKTAMVALDWAEPSIPIQTDDWYTLQMRRVSSGTTSLIRVVMDERRVNRAQAIAIIEQIAADAKELSRIFPDLQLPTYGGQDPEKPEDEGSKVEEDEDEKEQDDE